MPQRLDLKSVLLDIQDSIERFRDLDEFFELYFEALIHTEQKYHSLHNIRINYRRLMLLFDAHQGFINTTLKDLSSKVESIEYLIYE